MSEKIINKWHCNDCKADLMIEFPANGGVKIHCCFECGGSHKVFNTKPFIIGEQLSMFVKPPKKEWPYE